MNPYAIETFYGHFFDPTEPTVADIDLRDIAHALSLLTRANGHFEHFYSVARHSIACAEEAKARGESARVQLFALLHDGAESYIGDMTRPLRRRFPEFTAYERVLQRLIFEKYADDHVSPTELAAVKAIDDAMLYHEFLTFRGITLTKTPPSLNMTLKADKKTPAQTEREFLELYAALRKEAQI